MGDSQRQTLFTARQHALLTADFEASGIDPSRFGFRHGASAIWATMIAAVLDQQNGSEV